jgi:ankyrin repeat protein
MANRIDNTPIRTCVYRSDNEAAAVVHVLYKHDALPWNVSEEGESILHRAAWHCTPDTVSAVVQCYPNLINHATTEGKTPIMYAFYNDERCHEVVPRLIALGANVKAVTKNKESIVHFAFNGSPGALRLAKQYITPNNQLKGEELEEHHYYEDRPEEFAREAAPYGFKFDQSEYALTIKGGHSWNLWMTLRSGPLIFDGTQNDIFCALASSNDPQMWLETVRELGGMRHPKTGDTLLHMAAHTNKLFAVQLLMQRRLNPFILNNAFKRPVELSTDTGIVACLREYEVFRPERAHMDWLGPYFEHSAVMLLWVIKQSGSREVQQYRKLLATLILERLRRRMYA